MTNEPPARYLSDRFQWAAPGDQQEDVWIVRFCDNDVRDMLFTGPDAEREAWEAWERHAPGYNLYVFRLATLSTPPARPGREDLIRIIKAEIQKHGANAGVRSGEIAMDAASQILALMGAANA